MLVCLREGDLTHARSLLLSFKPPWFTIHSHAIPPAASAAAVPALGPLPPSPRMAAGAASHAARTASTAAAPALDSLVVEGLLRPFITPRRDAPCAAATLPPGATLPPAVERRRRPFPARSLAMTTAWGDATSPGAKAALAASQAAAGARVPSTAASAAAACARVTCVSTDPPACASTRPPPPQRIPGVQPGLGRAPPPQTRPG